jgi:hypothetical protein
VSGHFQEYGFLWALCIAAWLFIVAAFANITWLWMAGVCLLVVAWVYFGVWRASDGDQENKAD